MELDAPLLHFSGWARQVLSLLEGEAQRLNDNDIGTKHILLALLRVQECVGTRALIALNVDLSEVRRAVEYIIERGEGIFPGEIKLTPSAKHVLELAIGEARHLNHSAIDTGDLLVGLLLENEGMAAGILDSIGVTLEKIRAQLSGMTSEPFEKAIE